MCTRPLLGLLLLLAGPVQARGGGLQAPDAALVVILLDGLVEECVDARVDAAALMPQTATWVGRARRFTDVLTPTTNPGRARERLTDALAAFGADEVRRVRTSASDTLDVALAALGERPGRQVLVLDLPWLEPPLRLDDAILQRLDPAPWASMSSALDIESQVERRLLRAHRLAVLSGRGAGRGSEPLILDVEWVIRAAHADVDARLGALLERILEDPALASRASVVLTATSSTGTGVRGHIGPFIGVELDVARVPVFVWEQGIEAGVDEAPRQWIAFDPGWFAHAGPPDRYTWSWGPRIRGQDEVCELRWTTSEFTLIDSSQPRRPPRLHDRRLDPGEWYDRAVGEPALADSLRRVARARLYGEVPVVVFAAGDEAVTLGLACRGRLRLPAGRSAASFRIEPGETVRVELLDGAETLEFGRAVPATIAGRSFEISGLVLHSPAWRAALGGPVAGPGLRIWIE